MIQVFQYDFMIRAFAAGAMISFVAPIIGLFLVAKRYALLADTLSHVSLVGVALSIPLRIDPLIGAWVVSCISALGIEHIRRTSRLFGDSILALFLSGSLALALVLFSLFDGFSGNLVRYLFGSILTVNSAHLMQIAIASLLSTAVLVGYFPTFFLTSYDEELAQASGVPVRRYDTLLLIVTAITVSISMRVVGALLVGALMIIPVLTATMSRRGFQTTAMYAVAISLSSTIIGLMCAFYLNIPSGPAIVLVAVCFFLLQRLRQTIRR